MKKSARKDKRAFVEVMASQAERAAERGQINAVYKIPKQLCGGNQNQHAPIKHKNGNILSTDREQANRRVQHFCEILYRPEPEEPANPPPTVDVLDIDISPPTKAEVRCAIKALKNGKAAGIDTIHAGILKADLTTPTRVLTNLFNIWNKDIISEDWSKGLIIKLPKKGTLQNCDNWWGITLLSIPSKVFCRILCPELK